MKKTYYLFNAGQLARRDNTLKFTAIDEDGTSQKPRFLPVEGVSDLYVSGALDVNSSVLNFLGQQHIPLHFFDYYGNYTGSFMPRDYLQAGKLQVAQTLHYADIGKRMILAREFVAAAADNMLKNMRYYQHRERDLEAEIAAVEALQKQLPGCSGIAELMGIEGNIRQVYYQSFDLILKDWRMEKRSKQPPQNEVNALISFGNMMCYSSCLKMIYHTQLNPTISFLHEPGARRFSLALDLAEIFKPILVDRIIFKLLNKGELKKQHFSSELNRCLLKEAGRKLYIKAWEERLDETIKHRTLKKQVAYRSLPKLECYKLVKHLLDIAPYRAFRIWW